MSEGYQALTEKEKETLRLIVRGHDAKSTARHLNLSVHTVNERLRDARRKLSVSSSREAARFLLEKEGGGPDFLADRHIGDATPAAAMRPGPGRAMMRRWVWIGALIMSLFLAALALTAVSQNGSAPNSASPSTRVDAATATAATQSAMAWLALVDQERWDESWRTSGQQFQRANTSKVWADISKGVRSPLGAVASRTVITHERIPAPPRGYLIVRFRTSFTTRPEATETVSLEREGADWRVVGYWIG